MLIKIIHIYDYYIRFDFVHALFSQGWNGCCVSRFQFCNITIEFFFKNRNLCCFCYAFQFLIKRFQVIAKYIVEKVVELAFFWFWWYDTGRVTNFVLFTELDCAISVCIWGRHEKDAGFWCVSYKVSQNLLIFLRKKIILIRCIMFRIIDMQCIKQVYL